MRSTNSVANVCDVTFDGGCTITEMVNAYSDGDCADSGTDVFVGFHAAALAIDLGAGTELEAWDWVPELPPMMKVLGTGIGSGSSTVHGPAK